jgi:hypothetical protein
VDKEEEKKILGLYLKENILLKFSSDRARE